ncbi:hypothetical protein ERW49_18930 [Aliivibrio finisterrensis]|uniref:Uncharacterized protein n=1 Tax=Aliivibrio finisterrensis TaxID=511998 RepID=A0A4Q5K4G4_9GAMM|nr:MULTISPECIES: hypothetical protein [Aliivibrio]MDD9177063.1 hypothetical protein [Aliivibrio sp. S3TY1]MDD9194098.1 hypothetical protein [Aliivibrio sp. S2TY2]RYU40606.1 hypothetical protein ERW49_18930 [Aliivibrio finisterrensis]
MNSIQNDPPQEMNKKTPWYKKLWVVVVGISAVVSTLLIQGPTMLQNARVLPKEIKKTSDQFHSWVKEDKEWTGHWSAFPEGTVDMADLNLSDVDLQITLRSTNGNIDGTIATKKICQDIPVFDFILLTGEVSGNIAKVVAWDIIGGHRKEFATLTLSREGYVMTVIPNTGFTSWFPTTAKIARRPIDSDDPQPDAEFCSEEKAALFERLNRNRNTN